MSRPWFFLTSNTDVREESEACTVVGRISRLFTRERSLKLSLDSSNSKQQEVRESCVEREGERGFGVKLRIDSTTINPPHSRVIK